MNKDTFLIINKIWRLLYQEKVPVYTKSSMVLWANEHFAIDLFSFLKNVVTISVEGSLEVLR